MTEQLPIRLQLGGGSAGPAWLPPQPTSGCSTRSRHRHPDHRARPHSARTRLAAAARSCSRRGARSAAARARARGRFSCAGARRGHIHETGTVGALRGRWRAAPIHTRVRAWPAPTTAGARGAGPDLRLGVSVLRQRDGPTELPQ